MDDLRELFEGFSIHLQAAGRRPSTVDWYAKHARRFFSWLDQEEIAASPDQITALRIRKFIAHQQNDVQAWESNSYVPTQERGLSSTYISSSVRALRAGRRRRGYQGRLGAGARREGLEEAQGADWRVAAPRAVAV
jgi:hypothetical protein